MALMALSVVLALKSACGGELEDGFHDPPDAAKPWVFWFWINGNISREGITKDLEAMKRAGIGGVLWMEVSGPWWAPQGPIEGGSEQWHDAMQWAISEADRLDMDFDLSVDFGYGSGGPHITPDSSMQKLVWSDTVVQGGRPVSVKLAKPVVDYKPMLKKIWLRPGKQLDPKIIKSLEEIDSYRDIAVFAVKMSGRKTSRMVDKELANLDGRGWAMNVPPIDAKNAPAPIPYENIVDLTDRMDGTGRLEWSAPKGNWQVIRLGHASNFQMTRPCPHAAVGLECDRLNTRGMDSHFQNHLEPILDAAGVKAGRTLQYIHIDSWEAKGQNWSAGFAEEFQKRRGYAIRPWLPILTGIPVQNAQMTNRFLWDMRLTVSELMLDNYIDRLRELSAPYGVKFSSESYGHFCVDNLTYGGRADFPIAEFWTEKLFTRSKADEAPAVFGTYKNPAKMDTYCYWTMKSLASVANTYGKSRVGAEAFTGARGWNDHPWTLKNMGDHAFAQGINHYIYHLSAHQPYDDMVPGLTHRKWGQHIHRHQTWWEFSKPYFDYVARCQFLLRQGRTVADIAYLHHEGAPLNVKDYAMSLDSPAGYDYDLCSAEIVQRMEFKGGRIHLPSGVSYRYLVLPKSGRLTLKTAKKIDDLRKAGANVLQRMPITGTPGLEDYPEADKTVRSMAKTWPILPEEGFEAILAKDALQPDFQGEDLHWLHRRCGSDDIYFVANSRLEAIERRCAFRVTGKTPELWNPETGEIFSLPNTEQTDDLTTSLLKFEPSQSWFVVFQDQPSASRSKTPAYLTCDTLQQITGSWNVSFDPKWGTSEIQTFDTLGSWSDQSDSLVKYYSGTGVYRTTFDFARPDVLSKNARLCLDLGRVEVVARVRLNGKDCGITWKPPYRVEVSESLQAGKNDLQIEVANTWVNRLIGDEQLPLDSQWHDWETLSEWPSWFGEKTKRPSGRYTFTSARHYNKNSTLMPSGLLGPVTIQVQE
jgi:hypothetical protein